MMQTWAEITRSCGSVWENASQKWSIDRWGGRHGRRTYRGTHSVSATQTDTNSPSRTHTLQVTRTNSLLFTPSNNYTFPNTRLILCPQRLMAVSRRPAPLRLPPLAPKRERGLTVSPRHCLGCFCVDGAEGGGIMLFHVSEHRHDAMYLSSEREQTKTNRGEQRRKQKCREEHAHR